MSANLWGYASALSPTALRARGGMGTHVTTGPRAREAGITTLSPPRSGGYTPHPYIFQAPFRGRYHPHPNSFPDVDTIPCFLKNSANSSRNDRLL
jgi:hypothetical protein